MIIKWITCNDDFFCSYKGSGTPIHAGLQYITILYSYGNLVRIKVAKGNECLCQVRIEKSYSECFHKMHLSQPLYEILKKYKSNPFCKIKFWLAHRTGDSREFQLCTYFPLMETMTTYMHLILLSALNIHRIVS